MKGGTNCAGRNSLCLHNCARSITSRYRAGKADLRVRRQAGGQDDTTELPPLPLEPSPASAKPASLELGEFVTAAGVTRANRELVVDQLTATTRKDGRTAGETRTLPLALSGGEPSDGAVLWMLWCGGSQRCRFWRDS
jgi:hypothetical protein